MVQLPPRVAKYCRLKDFGSKRGQIYEMIINEFCYFNLIMLHFKWFVEVDVEKIFIIMLILKILFPFDSKSLPHRVLCHSWGNLDHIWDIQGPINSIYTTIYNSHIYYFQYTYTTLCPIFRPGYWFFLKILFILYIRPPFDPKSLQLWYFVTNASSLITFGIF